MSERCKQTSERTSKWPGTQICILGYSGPQWKGKKHVKETDDKKKRGKVVQINMHGLGQQMNRKEIRIWDKKKRVMRQEGEVGHEKRRGKTENRR